MPFDPDAIRVPCGHFIRGRRLPAADARTDCRPSDARLHAGLPVADAATLDAAVRDAAPPAVAVGARAAFHAVAGHANDSFGAADAANCHMLARRAC